MCKQKVYSGVFLEPCVTSLMKFLLILLKLILIATYIRHSEEVQDVFQMSDVRSIYVLCPGGSSYNAKFRFATPKKT